MEQYILEILELISFSGLKLKIVYLSKEPHGIHII